MAEQASDRDHYFLGVERTALRRYELFDEVYRPATEMRLATLAVKPNARVLDLGCGIGRTACYFAEVVVPDGQVVGIDQSEALVALARRFAAEQGIENVTFEVHRAQEHRFEPSAFDLAHTRYVLSYSPFAAEIVKSIHGALAPRGVFFAEEIVQDYVRHDAPAGFDRLCDWFARLIAVNGGDPNYGRNGLPSHMLDAGFADLTATSFAPLANQPAIIEMLCLALSSEMKKSIVDNNLGTAEDVDDAAGDLESIGDGTLISVAPAYQVTGVRR
jgi:ubiquinone/menaquinone biosynthesis C-methylase UbiE